MDTTANDLKNELLAMYATIVHDAKTYLAREQRCREAGIVAMVAHQWAVCLNQPGYSMAVETHGHTARLVGVKGDLIGTVLFTREDATKIIAWWKRLAPESTRDVVAVRDIDLVRARLAEAERQIAFLNTLVVETA